MTTVSVRSTINDQMTQVGREYGKFLPPLRDDLPLSDCGLDSLGFAVLVARLEDILGIDPFTTQAEVSFPATFGEFVKAYEDGGR